MPRKGNTTARGYGHRHQQVRRAWVGYVAGGQVTCRRCGELIVPGEAWDLGHDDHDRSRYTGPEHARCNRATNARPRARRPDPEPRPSTRW